jgi:hypothetical protein
MPKTANPARPTRITGFHQDAEGQWVAELGCGHTQHMRHRPPWQNRPWVVDHRQRAARVGMPIDCPLCTPPQLKATT